MLGPERLAARHGKWMTLLEHHSRFQPVPLQHAVPDRLQAALAWVLHHQDPLRKALVVKGKPQGLADRFALVRL